MADGRKGQFWKPGGPLPSEKDTKVSESQSKTSLSKAVMSMKVHN